MLPSRQYRPMLSVGRKRLKFYNDFINWWSLANISQDFEISASVHQLIFGSLLHLFHTVFLIQSITMSLLYFLHSVFLLGLEGIIKTVCTLQDWENKAAPRASGRGNRTALKSIFIKLITKILVIIIISIFLALTGALQFTIHMALEDMFSHV